MFDVIIRFVFEQKQKEHSIGFQRGRQRQQLIIFSSEDIDVGRVIIQGGHKKNQDFYTFLFLQRVEPSFFSSFLHFRFPTIGSRDNFIPSTSVSLVFGRAVRWTKTGQRTRRQLFRFFLVCFLVTLFFKQWGEGSSLFEGGLWPNGFFKFQFFSKCFYGTVWSSLVFFGFFFPTTDLVKVLFSSSSSSIRLLLQSLQRQMKRNGNDDDDDYLQSFLRTDYYIEM